MDLDLDRLYREGCRALPSELQEAARTLAHRLALVPEPDIPWSEVFQHHVTLGAPAFFAHLAAGAAPEDIDRIVISHMFGVIEAFGSDRLNDGQVLDPDGELCELMMHLRYIRGSVVQLIDPDAPSAFNVADRDVIDAMQREREVVSAARAVPLHRYERISLQKQAPGFPATMAIARLGAIGPERRAQVREALKGIWLGLQYSDDVVDWEEDYARGGAWAACIARGLGARFTAGADLATVQQGVFETGALAQMMALSRQSFELARDRARGLDADELARWAEEQRARAAEQEEGERRAPGYTLRAHKLRHFQRQVLL